jgi:hypothetical protein
MTRGDHRTVVGLQDIVRRAGDMNPSGKRGYTPVVILESLAKVKA